MGIIPDQSSVVLEILIHIFFSVPSKFSALGSFSHLARKFKMTHFLVSARRSTSSKYARSCPLINSSLSVSHTRFYACYIWSVCNFLFIASYAKYNTSPIFKADPQIQVKINSELL